MRLNTYLVLLLLCVLTSAQWSTLDSPLFIGLYRLARKVLIDAIGSDSPQGARLLKNAKEQKKIQDPIPESVAFPCDLKGARSARVPTSVDRLRPGDIDVIAALGDSLTAGTGVLSTHLGHLFLENRGLVAAGGGQGTWREYLTLPNILKEYNPGLIGYAYGDYLTTDKGSQFNLGENVATTNDTLYMAQTLVQRLKNDPRIDFKNHWKLIVLNVGANDMCMTVCEVADPWYVLELYKRNMLQTIRFIRDNLPRTILLIASPPHLRNLVSTDPQGYSALCSWTVILECPCMFALKYRKLRPTYYEVQNKWYEQEDEIVRYPEFHRKDFELMLAPCLRNAILPRLPNGKVNRAFMASDCFHISQRGNAWYANCLWNNLLEPVNKRSISWKPVFQRFDCPTEKQPYLRTHANSPE